LFTRTWIRPYRSKVRVTAPSMLPRSRTSICTALDITGQSIVVDGGMWFS